MNQVLLIKDSPLTILMGDDGGVLVQHQGLLQYMGLHLISDHVINQPGTVEQQCPAQVHCTQHIV